MDEAEDEGIGNLAFKGAPRTLIRDSSEGVRRGVEEWRGALLDDAAAVRLEQERLPDATSENTAPLLFDREWLPDDGCEGVEGRDAVADEAEADGAVADDVFPR